MSGRERPIIFSTPMVLALLSGQKVQTRRLLKPPPPPECGITYQLGAETWMPREERTPLRQTWEAWGGDLYANRPAGYLCGHHVVPCPYGQPGDRIYVRETCSADMVGLDVGVRYHADGHFQPIDESNEQSEGYFRLNRYRGCIGATVPPIHMPRWASRIVLEITRVRAERLNDISEQDAAAEGVRHFGPTPREALAAVMASNPKLSRRGFLQSVLAAGLMKVDRCAPDDPFDVWDRAAFAHLWESIHGAGSWDANPWVWVLEFERVAP